MPPSEIFPSFEASTDTLVLYSKIIQYVES